MKTIKLAAVFLLLIAAFWAAFLITPRIIVKVDAGGVHHIHILFLVQLVGRCVLALSVVVLFVVKLPELVRLRADLIDLRRAKTEEGNAPTVPLSEVKKLLGLED